MRRAVGNDYKNTPSFYNNAEYFNKYLGRTSYYINLQNVVDKIVKLTKPDKVLELGASLGTTSIKLAKSYPDTFFVGADLRPEVVELAQKSVSNRSNISFFAEDMCETVEKPLDEYGLIFMLYSFHHILDPLDRKVKFLEDCYKNMRRDSYLLILETFLPEEINEVKEEQPILNLWKLRAEEGYASTYWAALQELTEEGLDFANKVATISGRDESEAGNHVYRREDEYLIKFSWLKEKAKQSGFKVVIAEPVNCLYEKAILLRK